MASKFTVTLRGPIVVDGSEVVKTYEVEADYWEVDEYGWLKFLKTVATDSSSSDTVVFGIRALDSIVDVRSE